MGKTKFKTNLPDLLDFGEFRIHWSIQLWTQKETFPMSTSLLLKTSRFVKDCSKYLIPINSSWTNFCAYDPLLTLSQNMWKS